jgi:hypothetical protein
MIGGIPQSTGPMDDKILGIRIVNFHAIMDFIGIILLISAGLLILYKSEVLLGLNMKLKTVQIMQVPGNFVLIMVDMV